MADLDDLVQFTLTGLESATVSDTSDGGSDLDVAGVRVAVSITARPEVVNLQTTPPRTLRIRPVHVRIEDGVLVLPGGAVGDVRLVANAGLGITGQLLYDVKFGKGVIAGDEVDFSDQNFTFVAPTTDVSVDMTEVTRVSGSTPSGTVVPMVPDHVRLNVDGDVVFSANGVDIPNPLDIVVDIAAAWSAITGKPAPLIAGPNVANGYAGLDGTGKIGTAQLPISAMEYKGNWNASTNSPTLADGTGSAGDVYKVSVAATRNLGSGSIVFDVGDYAIYNGTTWEKSDSTDVTWGSIPGQPAVIGAGADQAAARAAIDAASRGAFTRQAALAADLKAHLWVDVNAGVYQRDGVDASLASILTHNTTAGRPYLDLNPATSNDIHAMTGGTAGVVGSGGALPTGWTLINPASGSVSVERVSTDGSVDLELLVTIPASSYIGYSSPDISAANATRHITFNLTAAATDLQYFQTQVGWVTGTPNSQITGGGGGQITAEIAGSSASTDKIEWLFKNLSTAPMTARILVRNVAVYTPAAAGGLRRNIQPIAFDTGSVGAHDVTVSVAAGDYFVFAQTEARGVVTERVTVGGSSFSLQSVVGNGRVTKLAVWKVADYVDGAIDVLTPPAWETIDEFDTGHLEMMSDQLTSAAKMHYQAPGMPWSVRVAVNRFGRSRIECRPGEYMVLDTQPGFTYAHAYQRRAEVYSGTAYPYDTDIWTSFAFKTDTMLSDPNGYGLIWQWLDTADVGDVVAMGPSLSLQLRQNGQLALFTASTTDPAPSSPPAGVLQWLGRFNVGAWNRVVMRTQFSQSGGGMLGLWLNSVAVYAYQATAVGYNQLFGVQPHYGFYGGHSRDTIVIDRANVEFGSRDLSSRITNPLPV